MAKRETKIVTSAVLTLQNETASKPEGNSSKELGTIKEQSDPRPQIFDQIIIGDKDVGTYKNTILKTLAIRISTGALGVTSVIAHKKYIEKAILSVGLAQMEFKGKLIISMIVERETSKLGRSMLKIVFQLLPEVEHDSS
jgi:hypothetical protein